MSEQIRLTANDMAIDLVEAYRQSQEVPIVTICGILRRAIVAEGLLQSYIDNDRELRATIHGMEAKYNKLLDEHFALGDRYDKLSAELDDWYSADTQTVSDFDVILDELKELHDKKSADYGTDEDPLTNIRQSERYGIPAWLGAILRGGDKVVRIQSFAKKGHLVNESVEDSIRDLAVYAVIALQLYREQQAADIAKAEEALAQDGGPAEEGEAA